MKKVLVGITVSAALAIGVWLAGSKQNAADQVQMEALKQAHPGTLAINSDPVEIFKKVMWRAPRADDKILNAERREWSEDGSVQQWQWFLQVEASQDLLDYLKVTNAFGIRPANSAEIANAPAWFPSDLTQFEIQRSGALTFFFRKDSREFFASSSGKGFAKALPATQAVPVTGPQPQGRVPSTSPPAPLD
jgi:hypothetical protein